MSPLDLLVLAAGLALDATAAAAAQGAAMRPFRERRALAVAALFGGFQGAMPVVGWVLGATAARWLQAWDHWVAFALLLVLGLRMMREGARHENQPAPTTGGGGAGDTAPTGGAFGTGNRDGNAAGLLTLVALALATSIDALAVGITLPLLGARLLSAVLTIGGVTMLFAWVGAHAGRRLGARLGGRLDMAGGVVLVGIGVKILVEHLARGE